MLRILALPLLLFIQNSYQQNPKCLLLRLDPLQYMQQPLILDQNAEDFLYPALNANNFSIEISVDDKILFSCPKSQLKVNETLLNSTEYAVCGDDSLFHINNISFNQYEIFCNHQLDQLASIREDQKSCGLNNSLIEIGFDMGVDYKFLTQSKICFNKEELLAQYVYYKLTPYSKFVDSVISTWQLIQDSYYPDIDLSQIFSIENCRKTINPLLGLPKDSIKYFNEPSYRLHPQVLTNIEDFIYGAQQLSMFRYINTAPTWLTLFNWNTINWQIRDYSINYELNLEVYSGTHGVLTLPHALTGEQVEIHLYGETGRIIKVPEVLWIAVFEPITKRALTIVMHNNIYLHRDSVVEYCNDIYEDITWIQLSEQHDPASGYSYVCSYADLKSAFDDVPEIDVRGILY